MKINNSFKEDILNKIKSEKVKMKPKLYFIVRPILFVFCLIMIVVFSIYFLSFLFFIFKINDGWALTSFGLRGVLALLMSLPWGIISFILLLMVVLETLLFRFSSVYRKPVLYSFLVLLVLISVISLAVGLTSFHDNMFLNRKLPWMGLYEGYERIDFRNIHCGKVLGITDNGFVIEYMDDPACMEVKVIVPQEFAKHKELKIGDIVILAGERKGPVINLIDLTKIDAEAFCRHRTRIESK
jgi:hypothetical protein